MFTTYTNLKMKLNKILKRKGYVKIELRVLKTNHLLIKGKINGVKGRFILDTGASNSCVDFDKVDTFNLQAEESETKAAGAGAIGMDTKISKRNTVKFSKWIYKSFDIVLFDLSHVNTALTEHGEKKVDGIIGADILEQSKAIIDYDKSCVYLHRNVFLF